MADVKMTEREREIASQIRNACVPIVPDVEEINEHRDAAKELAGDKGLVKTKLAIMANVAEMSSVGKWLPGEIKNATAYAAKSMSNAEPGDRAAASLATFLSEMNAVAHPRVRDRFDQLLNAVEDAWAAEEEELKKDASDRAPTPVRKWASRKYHAIMGVLRATKNDGAQITCKADVIAYATENDPDHNPERVAKRLESVAKTLQGIFADFANEDIGHAHRYIEAITADDLIQSRKVKIAKANAAAKAAAKANQPTSNVTPIVPVAPTPEPATIEPAEGAFDLGSEVLNDPIAMIEELAA